MAKKQTIQSPATISEAKAIEPIAPVVAKPAETDISFTYQPQTATSIVAFADLLSRAYASECAIESLTPNPLNPRINIADDNDNLIESIKIHGILEPIKAVRIDDSSYRIIQGHRRVLCAKEAGLVSVPCLVWDQLTREEESLLLNDHSYQKPLSSKLEYYHAFASLYDSSMKLPDIAVSLWPLFRVLFLIKLELRNAIKASNVQERKQLIISRCKGYLQQLEVGHSLPERITYTNEQDDTIVTDYPFKQWFVASLGDGVGGNTAMTHNEQKKLVGDVRAEKDKAVLTNILSAHLIRLNGLRKDKTAKPGATAGTSTRENADKRISKEALDSKINAFDSKVPAIATILSIANGEQPELKHIESDLMLVDWLKSVKQWDILLKLNCIRTGKGEYSKLQDEMAMLMIVNSEGKEIK
jgi:hypothetical protein